ncbi:DUF721 domain-containing protein [Candidatus Peregrinibacteria bacterium]|nr:DUF721 domain-containing protein [Candidatus Peregrinibacteria bacterium]
MKSFSDILRDRLKRSSLAPQVQAAEICFYADRFIEKYLGSEAIIQIKTQSIQGSTLVIGVLHPVLAEMIHGYEKELLADLQGRFGEKRITHIRTKCLTTL